MMNRLEIILKNGAKISVLCEAYKIETSALTGKVVSYEFSKCASVVPIYIDMEEIVAIIEVERI